MPDTKHLKTGTVKIRPGAPIAITEGSELRSTATAELQEQTERIGKTIKAYLVSTKDLLEGRYKHLAEIAPPHMTSVCRPTVFIFPEGILVRYDRFPNLELKVFVGRPIALSQEDGTVLELSLTAAAPVVSDGFLHCAADPTKYDPGERVLKFSLAAQSTATGECRQIVNQSIVAVTPLPSRVSGGAVRNAVGIRRDAISGNMNVSLQAARSIC